MKKVTVTKGVTPKKSVKKAAAKKPVPAMKKGGMMKNKAC